MYIISSRKDFWSNNEIVPAGNIEIRDVNLQTLTDEAKTEADNLKLIEDKKVLLLIHGYNNEPNDVMRAYATIEVHHTIINYFDVIVGYTWPGGDGKLDYHAAKDRAASVEIHVRTFLKATLEKAAALGVMSHSMGCRISLMAFEALQHENFQKRIPVWQFLMAAAVDNESIEMGERYYGSTIYDNHSYVFHSKHDPVLNFAYRIAEWDRALGQSGPESPADIHATSKVINCKRLISEHGAYKRTRQIYEYINTELTGTPAAQYSTIS